MYMTHIREEIRNHPVFKQEIPSHMNMGFPILEKKGESFLVSFLLHEEETDEKKIVFYPASYRVSFELPTLNLAEFKNLIIYGTEDITAPAAQIDTEYMLSSGVEIIDELYRWFDAAVESMPFEEFANRAIENYQGVLSDAAEALGLKKLYE